MTELQRHARRLLEAARRERQLPPTERERLLARLLDADGAKASDAPSSGPQLSALGKALLLAGLAGLIALGLHLASAASP